MFRWCSCVNVDVCFLFAHPLRESVQLNAPVNGLFNVELDRFDLSLTEAESSPHSIFSGTKLICRAHLIYAQLDKNTCQCARTGASYND